MPVVLRLWVWVFGIWLTDGLFCGLMWFMKKFVLLAAFGGCTDVVAGREEGLPLLNGLHLVRAACGDRVNDLVDSFVGGAKVCLGDEGDCDISIFQYGQGCDVVGEFSVSEWYTGFSSEVQCDDRGIFLDQDGLCAVDGEFVEGDASKVCAETIDEVRNQVREFCEDGEALKVLGELAGYLDWALSRVERVYDEGVEVEILRSGDRLDGLVVVEAGVQLQMKFYYVGSILVQFDLEVDGKKYLLQRPWDSSPNWFLSVDGEEFHMAPWGERQIAARVYGGVFKMLGDAMANAPLSSNSGSVQ